MRTLSALGDRGGFVRDRGIRCHWRAGADRPTPAIDLSERPAVPPEPTSNRRTSRPAATRSAGMFEIGRPVVSRHVQRSRRRRRRRSSRRQSRRALRADPDRRARPPQGCAECHNAPAVASGGLAHSSVARDVAGKGLTPFNVRSVTSLLGDGLLQLLAQEMTEALAGHRATRRRPLRRPRPAPT